MNIGINPYGQFLQSTQPNFNNYSQNSYGQQNLYQQQAQPTQNIIRVNGLDGAKAYTMGANSAVALFDSTESKFYLKVTDGASFPTITSYDFVIHEDVKEEHSVNNTDFVSRSEFDDFKAQILEMAQSIPQANKVAETSSKTRSNVKKVEE